MTAYRKLTQSELLAEATARFGDDVKKIAFQCPNCSDVATIADFIAAGAPDRAGQECIGRHLGALSRSATPGRDGIVRGERGCDWAAYGLICGPWEIVLPAEDGRPERSAWSFPLAPVPEAGGPDA